MKPLSRLLTLALLCCGLCPVSLTAQEVDNPQQAFMNNTWYLTKITIDGEEIPFTPNDEVPESTLTPQYGENGEGDGFWLTYCITAGSIDLTFSDPHHFNIIGLNFLNSNENECQVFDNYVYEGYLFNVFSLNYDYPFYFSITQNGDYFDMVIIADNGDKVYYQNVSLSTNENVKETTIVYPNPAKDFLFIRNGGSQALEMEIYDLSGKTLFKKTISETEERIDISKFPSGIYLYKIKTVNHTKQTGKIIKN